MVKQNFYTITPENERILKTWCEDWRIGRFVSKEKGSRKPITIINNYRRMKVLCYYLEKAYGLKDVTKVTEHQILMILQSMEDGTIKKPDGNPYKTIANYKARFKAFWNWYMKKKRKESDERIPNITEDIIVKKDRPSFTEISKEELEKLSKFARHDYKTLLWFFFDSGIRPQEAKHLRIGDIQVDKNEVVWLNIREEIAKKGSFGRRIKLHLSGELMKKFIENKPKEAPLFEMKHPATNRYIKRLADKLLKKRICLYDLRHSSSIYWINIIPKDNLLKYRFGWKNSDKIEYYSRYKGLVDDIKHEDLLEADTKTQLEKELLILRKQVELQKDQLEDMQKQAKKADLFIKLLEKKNLIKI